MSTVVYTLPRLFQPVETTTLSAGIYPMKSISDYFNHSGNEDVEAMLPEIQELEKHWTSIADKLAKLQEDIAAAKGPAPLTMKNPPLGVEALTCQQGILIKRLTSLNCLLDQFKGKLADNDQQPPRIEVDLFSQQRTLLERIRELNVEIKIISSVLQNNNNNNHGSLTVDSRQTTTEFMDLVIRANPLKPPHSLPLIKQQLEKRLGLKVFATTHVHSAAAQDMSDDSLRHFISSDPKLQRSNAQLAITLIWTKGDEEMSLMVSPSLQSVAIRGESNLTRFILRQYPALLLDYEGSDLHRTAQLDHLLDLSELITGSNKKERVAAIKMMDKPTSVSVTGASELNAVDFVLYSAVVNAGVAQEVGQHCRAWLDRCRGPISPRATLEKYLAELGVSYRTYEHPPAFTVEELLHHVSSIEGLHAKNLLVKDKKSKLLYLITARHDANVKLDKVAKLVGAKELRFADAETLEKSLGVTQGSVTPFALLNDKKDHAVTLVLDKELNSGDQPLNFHPLINNATTSISVQGFELFLQSTGHQPVLVEL